MPARIGADRLIRGIWSNKSDTIESLVRQGRVSMPYTIKDFKRDMAISGTCSLQIASEKYDLLIGEGAVYNNTLQFRNFEPLMDSETKRILEESIQMRERTATPRLGNSSIYRDIYTREHAEEGSE